MRIDAALLDTAPISVDTVERSRRVARDDGKTGGKA